jgi:hypothetical protein
MSRITDREIGRTTRSRISSTVWPTRMTRKPAFFGSIRHMTFTSMWTLFPSFVLNVMSSGIGRSPSAGLEFIRRFCCAMESVVQELTNGRTV